MTATAIKIDPEVLDVLSRSEVTAASLVLPEQLDRKLYMKTDKVLKALGGKWNRKEGAHIFASLNAEDMVDEALLTGEYTNEKKLYQFFETPEGLALDMIRRADIQDGDSVLEPSAGMGAIIKHIGFGDVCELHPDRAAHLDSMGYLVVCNDFLQYKGPQYDIVIGNPPFTRQQDIDHVSHMIAMARKRVVAIMSKSVMFRENKKTQDFRRLLNQYPHNLEALPSGTFKSSGTNVETVILRLDKE